MISCREVNVVSEAFLSPHLAATLQAVQLVASNSIDWYVWLSLVLIGHLLAVTVVGLSIFSVLDVPCFGPTCPERIIAAPIVGTAFWVVVSDTLSRLGLQTLLTGLIVAGVGLFAIAFARIRNGPVMSLSSSQWIAVALAYTVAMLGSLGSILVIATDGSFDAANDTLFYSSLADYLQSYSLQDNPEPQVYQPLLWSAHMLVNSIGTPVGPVLPLAQAESILAPVRGIEVFPAFAAGGIALNVLSVFFVLSSSLRASLFWALAGTVAIALSPNPLQSSTQLGYLLQTYGTASLMFCVGLLGFVLEDRRRSTWKSALIVGASYAMLAVTYSPVFPIAVLAAGWAIISKALRYRHSPELHRLARFCIVGAASFLVLTNFEAIRTVKALMFFARTSQAGFHIPWTGFEFLQFALGARVGGVETPVTGMGTSTSLVLLLVATLLVGTWRAIRTCPRSPILGTAIVLACMAGFYALAAQDPWTQERGQTWSLYKVLHWAFPVVVTLETLGAELAAQVLGRVTGAWRFPRGVRVSIGTIGIALLLAASSIAGRSLLEFEHQRAAVMQSDFQAAQPFAALGDLAKEIRGEGVDTVELVGANRWALPLLLTAYYLSPQPLASDWSNLPYLYFQDPGDLNWVNPEPRGKVALVGVGMGGACGAPLPAGMCLASDTFLAGVDNPNGMEVDGAHPAFWLGRAPARVWIGTPAAGCTLLSFGVMAGPSIPPTTYPRIRLQSAFEDRMLSATGDGTSISTMIKTRKGSNVVSLTALDPPTVSVLPNGDVRSLIAGIHDLDVGASPGNC